MSRRSRHGRHAHPACARASPAPGSSTPDAPGGTARRRAQAARPGRRGRHHHPTSSRRHRPRSPRRAAAPPVLPRAAAEVVPSAPVHGAHAPHAEPRAEAAALAAGRPRRHRRGLDGASHHLHRPPSSAGSSRAGPWVPLHELRRRFGISGDDDDVSPIRVGDQRAVHRPAAGREPRMVGELLSGGDVGYELSPGPGRPHRGRRLPDAARPPRLTGRPSFATRCVHAPACGRPFLDTAIGR